MAADVVASMSPLLRTQRLMGLFPVTLDHGRISFSKASLLTLTSFFLPYAIRIAEIFLFGWNQRVLTFKISVSMNVLLLMIKGFPMVFLFHPIVEVVNDLKISDNLLPSKPNTKNMYLWPMISFSVFISYYIAFCYFSRASNLTSFLMRLPITLTYQQDYQQLILFAFFVDQISARLTIVRTMRKSSDNARLAHATLCRSIRKLSEGFGLRYFLIVVNVGYYQLSNVFQNAYLNKASSNMQAAVFFASTDLCLLSLFALLSQALMNQGKIVSNDLLELRTANMDLKKVRQVELFLDEVRTTEINITAWGVFKIDIGIFGSFINTLLTFVIAMAGFSNEIIAIIEQYKIIEVINEF